MVTHVPVMLTQTEWLLGRTGYQHGSRFIKKPCVVV